MIDRTQRGCCSSALARDGRRDRGALVARLARRGGGRCCRASPARSTLLMFAALLPNDLVTGERSEALLWATACSLVTRAAGLPGRAAALAARARRARRPVPQHRRCAAGRAAAGARPRARRPGPADRLPAAGRQLHGRRRPPGAADRPSARSRDVERDGRPLAALVYDASLDDDPELVEAVTAAAGDRDRQRAPARRVARRSSPRSRPRASGSSRPATPSAGGSSATCTTARSSGWSGSRCSCGCCRTASATTRRRPRSSRPRATSSPTR